MATDRASDMSKMETRKDKSKDAGMALQALQSAGMGEEDIAAAADMSVNKLRQIMSGDAQPTAGEQRKLLAAAQMMEDQQGGSMA